MDNRLDKQRIFFNGVFVAKGMPLALKAMELVGEYHTGKRKCGAPEATHMFEVAGYLLSLMENRVPVSELDELVASAFIHDLVEDYGHLYPFERVCEDLNYEVHDITKLVTKKEGFKKNHEDRTEYFNGMTKDIRAVLIKIADRIHNLQSMVGVFSIGGQKAYIEEVEDYFYPMIKVARKANPEYFMALIAAKGTLERQISLIKEIHKAQGV